MKINQMNKIRKVYINTYIHPSIHPVMFCLYYILFTTNSRVVLGAKTQWKNKNIKQNYKHIDFIYKHKYAYIGIKIYVVN